MDEFISEITTMKTVAPHPNVVSLIGCCTIRQPYLMIMEYVGCGDLVNIYDKYIKTLYTIPPYILTVIWAKVFVYYNCITLTFIPSFNLDLLWPHKVAIPTSSACQTWGTCDNVQQPSGNSTRASAAAFVLFVGCIW